MLCLAETNRAFLPFNHIPDVCISVCNDTLAYWRTGDGLLPSHNSNASYQERNLALAARQTALEWGRSKGRRSRGALIRYLTGPPPAPPLQEEMWGLSPPWKGSGSARLGWPEPKCLTWLHSGGLELLWGQDQLVQRLLLSLVWVSRATSTGRFVVSCICPPRNTILQEYHRNPNGDMFRKTKTVAFHFKSPPWTLVSLHGLQTLHVTEHNGK